MALEAKDSKTCNAIRLNHFYCEVLSKKYNLDRILYIFRHIFSSKLNSNSNELSLLGYGTSTNHLPPIVIQIIKLVIQIAFFITWHPSITSFFL